MSYKLNKKLINLVPYDPITGHYEIRLDANESCFNLSDSLKAKINKSISQIDFNRYPDCLAKAPTKAFSELYNVPEELISAGNGSDELISIISSCFFEAGDTIVNVSNDFSMYEFYAQLYEVNVATYQKEADLTIDPDKLIAFCKENGAKGLIFSNPCNPTSLGLDRAAVKKIIEALDGCLVILDEAYMDFWDQSILSDADKYDNLIILKTCSKAIGLAAVRFGFAVANRTITNAIRAAKSPYNNDTVAQTIVADILSEKDYLAQCRDTIIANTKKLYSDILAIDKKYGCFEKIYEPCTNFVFVKTDEFEKIYSFMLENSIAIRKFKGYIRVTAGTEAENTRFIEVLDRYFNK
ncbi:pyridoxal phosphate-dependent aminotransferase [Ruminococcus flavefaciens]|uniref:pyridoxal phosphate-dependent aminotransferase n=1 Tax=Ruminococcus flavefaciens TaxID=1265 RepID=UPI0026ED8B18|nr:histidinol-phosphate transaminase [Ruminococcus flavefaciens]MDD7517722.1 histidinol-phosphate transaminase [Ruminococcus flavefaciens]MDY5690523.1 histidinol-phosphate transaminase [Ruminococcus flavefaciens]